MKWLLILLVFPTLVYASENCVEQIKGTCKDFCGPNEFSEQGAFIDCAEKELCCVETTAPGKPVSASTQVLMGQYAFSPAEIRIKAGTEVIWKNNDLVEHTVTAGDGNFDSGSIHPNGEYKKRFTIPGTYPYYCEIHPSMEGKIIVE